MLPAAAVPIVEEVRVLAVEIARDLEHSLTRLGMSVRHDHQYLRFFLPVPFRRFSQGRPGIANLDRFYARFLVNPHFG